MRILYLSQSYVPSRRASSVQVMKMCDALAGIGHRVTLVTKRCAARQEPDVGNWYEFYDVRDRFSIVPIPRPRLRGGGAVFAGATAGRLATRWRGHDVVYSRDLIGAWIAARLGYPVVFEAHGVPGGPVSAGVMRRLAALPSLRRMVTISDSLRTALRRLDMVPHHGDVVVAHDGADRPERSPPAASSGTGASPAPPKRLQVGYIGSLYPGKGADVVIELAHRIPGCDFHLVGGDRERLAALSATDLPASLKLHGFVEPRDLPRHYERFDVLLMPYQRRVHGATGRTDISRWMSPLKMFEYMGAGAAIVSSDLPVLREVLEHERNALLVPPDDPGAWAAAIRRLAADHALRARLGAEARRDLATRYTWGRRAETVLHGIDA